MPLFNYRYRWFYFCGICIVIFLLGGYFDTLALIKTYQLLQAKSKVLKAKPQKRSVITTMQSDQLQVLWYRKHLNQLMQYIHENKLLFKKLETIVPKKGLISEGVFFKMVLEGEYANVIALVQLLSQSQIMVIADFDYQICHSKIQLILKIYLLQRYQLLWVKQNILRSENPFCMKADSLTIEKEKMLMLPAQSIYEVCKIGELLQGQEIQMLVQNKRKEIFLLKKGILVGVEQARIINIGANSLSLALSNEKLLYLKIKTCDVS